MARILLVDDDPVTLRIIHGMLVKYGHGTTTAGSVKEAIKELESDPTIDLVITDLEMPESTGFDLLKRFNQVARFASLPVILCTSKADQETLVNAMKSGARDFIVKPFKEDTLVSKVDKALQQGKPSVHIMEDEALVLERLKYIIELEGFSVSTSVTAKDGLNFLDDNRVNIVIADIGLPDMTGVTLTRKIKEKYTNVSVFLISGLSARQSKDILECGADGFISKPFRNTDIIAKLRAALKQYSTVAPTSETK